jgi:hypothetical protein
LYFMKIQSVFSRFKAFGLLLSLLAASVFGVAAQDENKTQETAKKEEKPKQQQQTDVKNATAEQIAESVILIYGLGAGRANLNQIRRTTVENGKTTLVNPDGTTERITYVRRVTRGENLEKENVRLDQDFPNARFSLIYNAGKVFGLFNETVFTPRDEAVKSFESYLWHGLEALLRYKENGSTLAIGKRDKYMGVEFVQVDVTDKQNRTTSFFVSARTFRVMWLEYADGGTKYQRRFYDYRYAQGTLVPYRTTLTANDKLIEETTISTITFGQKIEDGVFQAG